MIWVILAITASILLSSVDLLDKFIMTQELKDPLLATLALGSSIFLFMTVFSVLIGEITYDYVNILISLLIGSVYTVALFLYFKTLLKEEVSRFAPIISTIPLFVLPFAVLIFDEVFTTFTYLGIFLVVAGSVVISIKKNKGRSTFDKMVVFAFLTTILFASRNLLIKYVTQSIPIFSILPWVGVGGILTLLTISILGRNNLKKVFKSGTEHLFAVGIISSLGMISLFSAISRGPISLVSSLMASKPLFVFLVATLVSRIHPDILSEEVSRRKVLHKTIGILLIVSGIIIVVT